jgi:hypothetical protein
MTKLLLIFNYYQIIIHNYKKFTFEVFPDGHCMYIPHFGYSLPVGYEIGLTAKLLSEIIMAQDIQCFL